MPLSIHYMHLQGKCLTLTWPLLVSKFQHCGVSKKMFLMEGDEDKDKKLFSGAKSEKEKERRLKRVKSLR